MAKKIANRQVVVMTALARKRMQPNPNEELHSMVLWVVRDLMQLNGHLRRCEQLMQSGPHYHDRLAEVIEQIKQMRREFGTALSSDLQQSKVVQIDKP